MIHHGIFGPFRIGFSGALDTAFTLLPQYLKQLGLSTHMIGKVRRASALLSNALRNPNPMSQDVLFALTQWHLGMGQFSQIPRARGFDSYLGYWNGAESYSNHSVGLATTNTTTNQSALGGTSPIYDFVDDTLGALATTQTGYASAGDYSTHVFSTRAVDIINAAAAQGPR